jgi:hypothetical protein
MNTQPKYGERRLHLQPQKCNKTKNETHQKTVNSKTNTPKPANRHPKTAPKQQKTNHTATTLSSYLTPNKSDNRHLTQTAPKK